jgi:hypothetical protein
MAHHARNESGRLEYCQPFFGHAGVQTTAGVIDRDRGIHSFEDTCSTRGDCGKEINERPGAPDERGELRQRSSPKYQTQVSVVNRKVGAARMSFTRSRRRVRERNFEYCEDSEKLTTEICRVLEHTLAGSMLGNLGYSTRISLAWSTTSDGNVGNVGFSEGVERPGESDYLIRRRPIPQR